MGPLRVTSASPTGRPAPGRRVRLAGPRSISNEIGIAFKVRSQCSWLAVEGGNEALLGALLARRHGHPSVIVADPCPKRGGQRPAAGPTWVDPTGARGHD